MAATEYLNGIETTPLPEDKAPAGETDVFRLLLVMAKHKRLILRTTIACAVIAAAVSLLLPNQYTAEAKLLTPEERDTMASMIGSMNSITGGLGAMKDLSVGKSLGLTDPNAQYVAILQSRTVADRLIERFDLRKVYHEKLMVDARKKLENHTDVISSKDKVITIDVTERDRKLAADLANAYVEEFQRITDGMALSEAAQRRVYFERELNKAKQQLTLAEAALQQTQEKTGILEVSSQSKAIVNATVELKAEVAAKEIEIQAMTTFATPENPDLVLARQELAALQAQLQKIERSAVAGGGEVIVPTGKIPEAGLEYLRRFRDVQYDQMLYKLLAEQYEAAKVDEGRNAIVIPVLDTAVVPEKKSKPHRALIVILTTLLAACVAMGTAYMKEAFAGLRRDPVRGEQLALLQASFSGGRRWWWPFK
jgi:uncharacterized protein involved in exopolysaccharide biosynthesis